MDNEQQLFLANVKGSAAANFITGMFVLIVWILKNKCKHSTCSSHNCCFDCEVKEDNDIEEGGHSEQRIHRQETRKFPKKIKINMQKLHRGFDHGVFPKREKAIQID